MPIADALPPIDDDLAPWLQPPLATAVAAPAQPTPNGTLRTRLLGRVATSRIESAAMFTTRLARTETSALAPGVRATTLYRRDDTRAPRAGEPLLARLIHLEPGARWSGPDAGHHREWLVLRGTATVGDTTLGERDFHVQPAGATVQALASTGGASVFLREAALPALEGDAPLTVRDAEAGWPDYAPGVARRVLWHRAGEASMLYYAQPGAAVPRHAHDRDEECLMVQGELYLDDMLLQAGDYQLAPAGTGHHTTATDTGIVIYAHGDLDLHFVS
jgi:anti-sigma factor ChrR (cupin superfamily)